MLFLDEHSKKQKLIQGQIVRISQKIDESIGMRKNIDLQWALHPILGSHKLLQIL
jgi:hypothetical protein